LPKNADFLRFFWVSAISRDWNQETLERLYRTKRSFDDTFMRSIHSGFSWVFAGISNPADTTDRARSAVRATMARLASRRRRSSHGAMKNVSARRQMMVPVSQVVLKPPMSRAIVEMARARWPFV